MPLAKIHVVEGRYDEARMGKVSNAVQAALMNTLRVPWLMSRVYCDAEQVGAGDVPFVGS
jgi:hypothetical protein